MTKYVVVTVTVEEGNLFSRRRCLLLVMNSVVFPQLVQFKETTSTTDAFEIANQPLLSSPVIPLDMNVEVQFRRERPIAWDASCPPACISKIVFLFHVLTELPYPVAFEFCTIWALCANYFCWWFQHRPTEARRRILLL